MTPITDATNAEKYVRKGISTAHGSRHLERNKRHRSRAVAAIAEKEISKGATGNSSDKTLSKQRESQGTLQTSAVEKKEISKREIKAICNLTAPLANSRIIESEHFKEICKYSDSNTLIVCDIDDTLIEPTTWLGSDEWFCREMKHYCDLGYPKDDALELALGPWSAIQQFITVKLVEEGTDKVIRKLQKNAFHLMALTTRSPNLASRTIKQLKELNIDFSSSAPIKGECVFLNPREVLYKQGALFTAGTAKGEALFKLIPKIKEQFSKILFINDKETHLADMQGKCATEGVEFLGLRYGAADSRKKSHDDRLAAVQFSHFAHLLSNEEASQSLIKK